MTFRRGLGWAALRAAVVVHVSAVSGAGCTGESDTVASNATGVPSSSSSSGSGGSGGSGGGGACDAATEPAPPSADWCARVTPGASGTRAIAVDLSAAHAGVRFFGPVAAYADADVALVAALAAPDAVAAPDLDAYAAALAGVACSVRAANASDALGEATIDSEGDVALIHPGTGAVALPAGTRAVLVDLRDLPNVAELRAVLEAAVAPALASDVMRPTLRVRKHEGLSDEVFTATSVYTNAAEAIEQDAIVATGAEDLPLGLLTGPVMAPDAVELAATLRLAGRAFLFGESLRIEVAESQWQGVGDAGVAYRAADLANGNTRWPDEIAADRRMEHPECARSEILSLGAPRDLTLGAAERPAIEAMSPFGDKQPIGASLGEGRAALLVSHGTARTFFPYFAVVGDIIDARLEETLDALGEPVDRASIRDALRRFGAALSDGHCFVFDYGSAPAGSFPVYVEDIAGEAVVRRSLAAGVDPGDAITSIGGVPAADWYATELARTSAATDGYRFNVASRRYMTLDGPTAFGLRDPDGVERVVNFVPQPIADITTLGFLPTTRPSGSLGDLGAPSLYYLNLAGEVTTDLASFQAAMTEAASAAGLVVDMRGYPAADAYAVAKRLMNGTFSSPIFRVTTLHGLVSAETNDSSYTMAPSANAYPGSIALIVGHGTVSAAENFSTMLVDANRVEVFGRRSAGTNGNITGVQLPGGFAFTLTGMEVLHADAQKSTFHGIGIVPAEESTLSAASFRDGIDPELEDAIAWLLTQ